MSLSQGPPSGQPPQASDLAGCGLNTRGNRAGSGNRPRPGGPDAPWSWSGSGEQEAPRSAVEPIERADGQLPLLPASPKPPAVRQAPPACRGEAEGGRPDPARLGGSPGAAPGGACPSVPGEPFQAERGKGAGAAPPSWESGVVVGEGREPPPSAGGRRPCPPGGGGLGKIANNVTPPQTPGDLARCAPEPSVSGSEPIQAGGRCAPSEGSLAYRAQAYELRDGLRGYAPRRGEPGARVRACGRVRVGGEVAIVEREGRCHYCGLVRCGSVWSCPVCSSQIRAERAKDVTRVVEWHAEKHGAEGAQLLTLTLRHRYGDQLADLRFGLSNAYRRFVRGEPWKRFVERVGLVGSVRALEVTHGGNGWHPHLHAVVLVRDAAALASELPWLRERWQECVVRELGVAAEPNAEHGVDLRPCHRADYLAKLGLEVVAPGSAKAGRQGNRTPWEIAADLCALPHPHDERSDEDREQDRSDDKYLWQTWLEDMRGARMLTWSRGLREQAGLGEELTDEEIVEGEGANDRTVVLVPGAIWDAVREVRGIAAQLLAVAEREGASGVEELLAMVSVQARAARAARAAASRHAAA